MDFKGIKEIIDIVNSSEITYFNFESSEGHLILDKSLTRNEVFAETTTNESKKEVVKKEVCLDDSEVKNEVVEETQDDCTVITSPMVGTYYSSPSPEADSFVQVGDRVNNGKVLCIIEAMKLMNEIESEVSGTIKEILVKDGEMVEYGQPLFKIKED